MEELRQQKSNSSVRVNSFNVPLRLNKVRTHNLKNVSVEIPRNKITAITGPSGCGKSSLAFDTIYVEGQRQYMECLSTYTRQFLRRLIRPDVESVSGIQPTIAVDQRSSEPNGKSTVATITEVFDFLRELYAHVGVAHCYKCGRRIQRQSIEQIQEAICRLPEKTRFVLFAPIVRECAGGHTDLIQHLIRLGFVRARIDGNVVSLDNGIELEQDVKHTIEVVIDRLVLRDDEEFRTRLLESLKSAILHSGGLVCCSYEKERQTTDRGTTRSVWQDVLFNTKYSCSKCGVSYADLEPRSFSFNSPYGACKNCHGIGKIDSFDPDLLVSNSETAVLNGALALGRGLSVSTQRRLNKLLDRFQSLYPEDFSLPINQWSEQFRRLFFYGNAVEEEESSLTEFEYDSACFSFSDSYETEEELEEESSFESEGDYGNSNSETEEDNEEWNEVYSDDEETIRLLEGRRRAKARRKNQEPECLIDLLECVYFETKSNREREYLDTFRRKVVCSDCKGTRIKREARSVTIAEKSISEAMQMTVLEALEWFQQLQFEDFQIRIATPLVSQICERLKTMKRLRLDYLTLDRPTDSLSGGELQRVRLTTALGNTLSGVCYILDEPTTGLHPRDTERLLDVIDSLRDRGNTVVLVEHNEKVIRHADHMIDMGPGAGCYGGEVLACGSPKEVADLGNSPTARFLSGKYGIAIPEKRRKAVKTKTIRLEGVTTNNLKDVSVVFPLGLFICVTGVSGSGKSSLIKETLVPAIRKRLRCSSQGCTLEKELKLKSIRGARFVDKLVVVDQAPLGRNPRSNPLTYSKVLFDEIRKVFANTIEARRRGYKAGRFSFNIAGGRCEDCQGLGYHRIESSILPDTYVPCVSCEGKRFNRATLEIKYQGKSIADVMDMSFEEASVFWANHTSISRYVNSFVQVGLGYLKLGQSATSLSGGEAQRVKLASELASLETGNTLYVLDEPTVGLHSQDIEKLLSVLNRLVDAGNTVVVIEHSVDVMKVADWIIDLGPEGGCDGGQVLAVGSPEEIVKYPENDTARCLREVLISP